MPNTEVECRALAKDERWFVVHSKPNSERKADYHLRAQGFRTCFPQILKTIRHARRLRTVRAPLFPRYLFVGLDLGQDRFLAVRSTVGVSRIFSHRDGRPVPVPTGIVETLIKHADGDLTRLDVELVQGQNVRILTGPFAEFFGKLERFGPDGRVQVLLELMGTAVPVSLHRCALAPAA